jgi:F420-non-reducing hydrogenase large subunit
VNRVTIDPVTRIEGHGRVEILLDASGEVAEAYFVVPELRGFEQLCVGRPVEEMPGLTSRVCGLCPEAHHIASAKALDVLFGVEPTPAARAIRELLYSAFVISNHATHFFALAGPDFLLGEDVPDGERTLFGVLKNLGPDLARRVLANRVHNHEVIEMLGGRRIHPVAALPGGWSRRVTEEMRRRIHEIAEENVAFALDCLQLYQHHIDANPGHLEMVTADGFTQPTSSMATVDQARRLAFYDGTLRVVDPAGSEVLSFAAADYQDHIAEHVEPWTFMKLPYLKAHGWTGLADGATSGVFAVGPLARLNTCDGLATPLAQQAFEAMYSKLGAWSEHGRHRPIHHRLASHWARLVELLHAAERMAELASAPELTGADVRARVPENPVVTEAVGCVEAPRGTLIHHYTTDSEGIVTGVNLIVATTHNHAAIALSVTGAARTVIGRGAAITGDALNHIETAIRAHDPCLACATHTLFGEMPLELVIREASGIAVAIVRR